MHKKLPLLDFGDPKHDVYDVFIEQPHAEAHAFLSKLAPGIEGFTHLGLRILKRAAVYFDGEGIEYRFRRSHNLIGVTRYKGRH